MLLMLRFLITFNKDNFPLGTLLHGNHDLLGCRRRVGEEFMRIVLENIPGTIT